MKTIAIIPARSGSKGLKNKNIIDVCGRPLIDYTIKAALSSACFDTVMVSTDSEEYAHISQACGADVPFLRSEFTASDIAGTWDVVREVLINYQNMGQTFAYVAVLQPTSPLRSAADIKGAYNMLRKEGVSNVVSVTNTAHPVQWCFTLDHTLSLKNYADSPYVAMRRQELEPFYQENGAIYIVNAEKIMDKNYNIYKDQCYAFIMPRERSIDIDEEIDLIVLKAMIQSSRSCEEE
ncbi:acylneuraminate cytidylyltransferase family protein [Lachnospiraceae bacterium 45-W7]